MAATMPAVILASASPRRRELLALSGLDFEARPAALPEVPLPGEAPAAFARRMSQAKARQAAQTAPPGALVIGADTIVVLDGQIIGKPDDPAHAARLLRRLRARPHQVLTALTVLDPATGRQADDLVSAAVPMRAYTDAEITAYVATGNPLDKAGAYAIQYGGFQPVDLASFGDCFANVMGLPVCSLLRLVDRLRPGLVLGGLGDCHRFDERQCPFFTRINQERPV
jgi:MAF protein